MVPDDLVPTKVITFWGKRDFLVAKAPSVWKPSLSFVFEVVKWLIRSASKKLLIQFAQCIVEKIKLDKNDTNYPQNNRSKICFWMKIPVSIVD